MQYICCVWWQKPQCIKAKAVPVLNQAHYYKGIIFNLSNSFAPRETAYILYMDFIMFCLVPLHIKTEQETEMSTRPKTWSESAAQCNCWLTYHSLSLPEYEPSNDSPLVGGFGGTSSFVLELFCTGANTGFVAGSPDGFTRTNPESPTFLFIIPKLLLCDVPDGFDTGQSWKINTSRDIIHITTNLRKVSSLLNWFQFHLSGSIKLTTYWINQIKT